MLQEMAAPAPGSSSTTAQVSHVVSSACLPIKMFRNSSPASIYLPGAEKDLDGDFFIFIWIAWRDLGNQIMRMLCVYISPASLRCWTFCL